MRLNSPKMNLIINISDKLIGDARIIKGFCLDFISLEDSALNMSDVFSGG